MKNMLRLACLVALFGMLILGACSAPPSESPRPAPAPAPSPAPYTTAPSPSYVPAPAPAPAPRPAPAPTTAYPTPIPRPSPTAAPAPRPTTVVPAPTAVPRPTPTIPSTAAPAPAPYPYPYPSPTPTPTTPGTIGMATGGAKDIANFRENISNKYLPLPTDITYEGLFYDYFFDTGMSKPTNKLYAPSYSYAVTRDPISRQTEYYMAVGLNSGIREEDFRRKKLNLVIVLDSSGSMGELYNQYYYDRLGGRIDAYAGEGISRLNKIDSAKDAVVSILNQLEDSDRFAVVIFNSNAFLVKPMGLVRNTDMRTIKNNVLDIRAGGSTNMSAGMDMAVSQFRNLFEVNSYEYENRIILLTDAQPNTGDLSTSGLMGMVRRNADSRIYSTFIGIGVDFNSQLIEEITKVRGANYYSVHSPKEFRERVADEFEYMVTPLVFNLQLNFESRGWRIEKVFGSPEADQASGQLMKINTLFPSKREGGETKGGLVLLKLRKMSPYSEERIYLRVTYEDRNGRIDSSEEVFTPEGTNPEYFDNTGIRKGILLSRYAALLKYWMIDERQHLQYSRPWDPCIGEDTGILLPPEPGLSQWERQSLPLTISEPYRRIFRDFSRYFESEMSAIKDYALDQELGILNTLAR